MVFGGLKGEFSESLEKNGLVQRFSERSRGGFT
jgi:hypothetical protein